MVTMAMRAGDRRRKNALAGTAAARWRVAIVFYAGLGAVILIAGSAVVPSPLWAFGALGLFAVFSLLLVRAAPFSFIMLAPLIVLRLTEFLSGAAIESGAYMSEAGVHGYPSGAFARLLLLDLLFFAVVIAILEHFWPRIRRIVIMTEPEWTDRLRQVRVVAIAAVVFCSIMIAYTGLTYGFPILTGEDRFRYLNRVDFVFYKPFLLNRALLTPFFGLLLTKPAYQRTGICCTLWLIVVSVLFAEKFTSLVLLSIDALVPLGILYTARGYKIPIVSTVIGGLFLTVLTVPAVLLVYGARSDLGGAIARFEDRASLQGQLWFLTDAKFGEVLSLDGNALHADVSTWMVPSAQKSTEVGTRFGLYYVMQDYTRNQELAWIMEGGNGYVFAQLPYLLKATGYFGTFVIMSVVAMYGATLALLIALALFQVNYVAILAAARVNIFLYGFYIAGYFWNIFGVKTLLAVTVLIASLLLGLRRSGQHRRQRSISA